MNVRVNGASKTVEEGSTVSDLIDILGFRRRSVVVERNGEPVARAQYESARLHDGDVLEVVRAVPGG